MMMIKMRISYNSHVLLKFPVIKLVSMLAFENEMEALEFFQLYGLQTENGNLILDRSAFYQPESFPLLKRARQIIDSKRHCSVGEVSYSNTFF